MARKAEIMCQLNQGQHQTSTGTHGSSGWSLVCTVTVVMTLSVFFQLDVSAIVRAISLCLLTLGLFTFVLYLVGDRLEAGWKWFFQRQKYQEKKGSGLSAEELSHQQRAVCERIQNEYNEKASRYEAEVARPRREAKKAQLEREFYKFAGPAWKGVARSLDDNQSNDEKAGSASKQQLPRKGAQGTSKDAATVRKLPDSATRQPQAVPNKPQQVKKVIVLPNEPDTRDKKCITVALRGLRSTVTKRRFLYTEKVQVLLDWMAKQGYHPKLYTVCTTFPRRDLSQHAEETLEDMHLVRDVVLAIEERE